MTLPSTPDPKHTVAELCVSVCSTNRQSRATECIATEHTRRAKSSFERPSRAASRFAPERDSSNTWLGPWRDVTSTTSWDYQDGASTLFLFNLKAESGCTVRSRDARTHKPAGFLAGLGPQAIRADDAMGEGRVRARQLATTRYA